MHSTPNPKHADPDDVLVVAPDVVLVAHADKSDPAHDAISRPWDAQTRIGSDFSAGPSIPPVDTTFRAAAVSNVRGPGGRPSIGARAIRAFMGFLLALCIGLAGFAWQSYGDAAKQMIARWAPQLALTSSPPLENPGLPEQPNPPAVQASAAKATPPQPPALAQTTPERVAPAAALSPEAAQSLQSMGQEIEQLKASIAQLKASQEQMSRDNAKVSEAKVSEAKASEVRPSEQNLRPRISAISPPPRRPAVAPVHRPMPPPYPPSQAAAVPPPLPQAVAPYVPPQPEPLPQVTAQPQDEPVPRPPMPVR
jgi:hypothetical protein